MKALNTIGGDKVFLERFKEWWHVKVCSGNTSYTVFQSKSRTQAVSYMEQNYHMPCVNADLGTWYCSQNRGQVVRRILVYP